MHPGSFSHPPTAISPKPIPTQFQYQIYRCLCPSKPLPKPRHATLRRLYTPHLPPSPSTLLDSGALILFFPGPNTVTGEDVLELHVHGGPAIVRAILAAIPACAAPAPNPSPLRPPHPHPIRPAAPGEFTRRAFTNARLSLPQIEALRDSLAATTEQQRVHSLRTASGSALTARYETWRAALLHARAELEALLDFAEDQHLDESPRALCGSVAARVGRLRAAMRAVAVNAVRGELLRGGIGVALLGAPNAGKSSLLNQIVGREAAIVSCEAGTTRDVVEVGVDLGGWLVRVGDMAGLRRAGVVGGGGGGGEGVSGGDDAGKERERQSADAVGAVEQEGIKRAKQRALSSDVVIVVADASAPLDPEVTATAKQCVEQGINVVVAINKADQLPHSPPSSLATSTQRWQRTVHSALGVPRDRIFFISCKDADAPAVDAQNPDPGHIQAFLRGLIATFESMTAALVPDLPGADGDDDITPPDPSVWQESLGATERQRVLLDECIEHLDAFLACVHRSDGTAQLQEPSGTDTDGAMGEADVDVVVAAESLRAAAECVARITGRGDAGDVEEVLGVVFEK